jgi:hypothetical protein
MYLTALPAISEPSLLRDPSINAQRGVESDISIQRSPDTAASKCDFGLPYSKATESSQPARPDTCR